MVIFYKKWKKYNEIKLMKNKLDFIEQSKNEKSSPLRRAFIMVHLCRLHNVALWRGGLFIMLYY